MATPALKNIYTCFPGGGMARAVQGHKVACHTYTHPTVARCPIGQVVRRHIGSSIMLDGIGESM